MYKMKQVVAPCVNPWAEYFFDGEVTVINNIVEFDREHWRDALYQRGFVDIVEKDDNIGTEVVSTAPVRGRGRPKKNEENV